MASEKPKHPKSKTHKNKTAASKHSAHTTHAHKKVFDIVPPGKSPAAPNSRSVIVGHKPRVQDDQFVKKTPESGSEQQHKPSRARLSGDFSEDRPLLDSHKKVELRPEEIASKKDAEATKTVKAAPKSDESKGTIPPETAPTAPLITKSDSSALNGSATASGSSSASEVLADLVVEQTVQADEIETRRVRGNASASDASSDSSTSLARADADTLASSTSVPVSSRAVHIDESGQLSQASAHDMPLNEDPAASPGLAARLPLSDAPANGASPDTSARTSEASGPVSLSGAQDHPKTVDDLLAESSPPELVSQKAIVSNHHRTTKSSSGNSVGSAILLFLLILILAAITLDILLDAGIVETRLNIPYTDLVE